MKKIILFAIAALSLALASCNKEQIPSEQENGRKFSMTLSANVNETKATMSDEWKFAFATGDKISLTNNQVIASTYYELTRGSDSNFTGEVTAPSAAADWYAYYPSHSVSLAGQTGTQTGTAAYCALAGKQENVAADSKNLSITLNFQTAILVIDNQKGAIDINVKTSSDDKWVSGFAAKTNDAAFDVTKSDTKVSLFTASATGTHYVVVPAGVKIAVYDGDTKIKETKDAGLSAGKYYSISVAPAISTIADVLATVEGGFPLMTGNRWTNGCNKYAGIFNGNLLLNSTKYTIPLSTSVTKGENCYTVSVSTPVQGNLTFNMNDGILTNFVFKATNNDYISVDGIYYAPPLPVKVSMSNGTATDKYDLKIDIKEGSDITSCSYYLAEKTEINSATDLESLVTTKGTNLDAHLEAINSSGGYSVYEENCETGKGYKIVLVVTTSDGKKTIVVGGYYVKAS